jgi:hypothetical protein
MSKNEQLDVIIYRVRDQGLEVFLVNPEGTPLEGQSPVPSADRTDRLMSTSGSIELDSYTDTEGLERKAIAIEADWHEIPSLRALMYEDYRVAKEKARQHLKSLIPDQEQGTYVAIKDAFKRVLPEQYAFLKELKDIIVDRIRQNTSKLVVIC